MIDLNNTNSSWYFRVAERFNENNSSEKLTFLIHDGIKVGPDADGPRFLEKVFLEEGQLRGKRFDQSFFSGAVFVVNLVLIEFKKKLNKTLLLTFLMISTGEKL